MDPNLLMQQKEELRLQAGPTIGQSHRGEWAAGFPVSPDSLYSA